MSGSLCLFLPFAALQVQESSGQTSLTLWRWTMTSLWPRCWPCCCLTLCFTRWWPGTWRPFFLGSMECLYHLTSLFWWAHCCLQTFIWDKAPALTCNAFRIINCLNNWCYLLKFIVYKKYCNQMMSVKFIHLFIHLVISCIFNCY